MNEDTARMKMEMLANAITEVNDQNSMDELKAAAFEVLLLNPGSEQADWSMELVTNYSIEVIDAFGTDPGECFTSLVDFWNESYLDPATGIEKSYSDWAATLCNEQTVELYYELVEARKSKQGDLTHENNIRR